MMKSTNTLGLMIFILLLLAGILFGILQAEGGIREFPRLIEQACKPCVQWLPSLTK